MGLIHDLKVLTGQKSAPPPQTKVQPQKKKILVVEDEKALAKVLSDRFTDEGYRVFEAANGEEGLAMVKEHRPDVVLLDLLMPIMDGKSMLIKLRELPEGKKLPVIVLTNAGEVENIRVTKHYFNAVDFFIKSNVTLDEIVQRVKDFTW